MYIRQETGKLSDVAMFFKFTHFTSLSRSLSFSALSSSTACFWRRNVSNSLKSNVISDWTICSSSTWKWPDMWSISSTFHMQIPKVQKNSEVVSLFALLGSACAKAACRMLMTLTPGGIIKFSNHWFALENINVLTTSTTKLKMVWF